MSFVERFRLPDASFWQGKRVLLTGHTGFKGSWLSIWLNKLGAEVHGLSLKPETTPSLFDLAKVDSITHSKIGDIRDANQLTSWVKSVEPDIVFHLAAQALVRESYASPLETFETNVMGTAHILEAIRGVNSVKAVVLATTDKVYHNNEYLYPYRESDALGGYDPYSASKAASEMVISSYRDSFLDNQGVAIASARAGNVIGGGDWSKDRLIPDVIRAWKSGVAVDIRRPEAIRPWQHVLEPVSAYMMLAESLVNDKTLSSSYNFGPNTQDVASVRRVIEMAQQRFPAAKVKWGDGQEGPHEAGCLTLEVAKAKVVLGIEPRWKLTTAVNRTMDWYQAWLNGENIETLCAEDIAYYMRGMNEQV